VAHQAAQMSVSRSVREPLFDASVNLIGSINMLEAAREVGARFVFASTGGALYGDADVLPTPESYPAWPVSPYGVGKLSFEHYLHCYGVVHGLSYAALRYANVYGPRQNPHGEAGVVAIFCLRRPAPTRRAANVRAGHHAHRREARLARTGQPGSRSPRDRRLVPPGGPAQGMSAGQAAVERYFERLMELSPVEATYYGLHRHDHR